jgi:hypothetical protein
MRPPMQGQLSSLSENLCAVVYATDERFLVGMCVLVLSQILWQSEGFGAIVTLKRLYPTVNVVVPFERELRGESLSTSRVRTVKHFLFFLGVFHL